MVLFACLLVQDGGISLVVKLSFGQMNSFQITWVNRKKKEMNGKKNECEREREREEVTHWALINLTHRPQVTYSTCCY